MRVAWASAEVAGLVGAALVAAPGAGALAKDDGAPSADAGQREAARQQPGRDFHWYRIEVRQRATGFVGTGRDDTSEGVTVQATPRGGASTPRVETSGHTCHASGTAVPPTTTLRSPIPWKALDHGVDRVRGDDLATFLSFTGRPGRIGKRIRHTAQVRDPKRPSDRPFGPLPNPLPGEGTVRAFTYRIDLLPCKPVGTTRAPRRCNLDLIDVLDP